MSKARLERDRQIPIPIPFPTAPSGALDHTAPPTGSYGQWRHLLLLPRSFAVAQDDSGRRGSPIPILDPRSRAVGAPSHQPPATAPSGAPRSSIPDPSSHDSPAGHSKCHIFRYHLVSYPSALSRSPGIQSGVLSMIPVISSTGVPSLHSTITSSCTWPQMK